MGRPSCFRYVGLPIRNCRGGESEIRTHETLVRSNGFRDRRLQPLSHLSRIDFSSLKRGAVWCSSIVRHLMSRSFSGLTHSAISPWLTCRNVARGPAFVKKRPPGGSQLGRRVSSLSNSTLKRVTSSGESSPSCWRLVMPQRPQTRVSAACRCATSSRCVARQRYR